MDGTFLDLKPLAAQGQLQELMLRYGNSGLAQIIFWYFIHENRSLTDAMQMI